MRSDIVPAQPREDIHLFLCLIFPGFSFHFHFYTSKQIFSLLKILEHFLFFPLISLNKDIFYITKF